MSFALRFDFGVLFLLVVVILLYLETLFSTFENKYIGLIFPAVSFLASFLWLFNMKDLSAKSLVSALLTLVIANIPTLLFLLIYRHKRKQMKKK